MAEADLLSSHRTARRVAVISMHTSPTASLGQNANGGLNVYVREICAAFSDRGIASDVFTRRGSTDPAMESLAQNSCVIYLPAGRGLDKYSLYDQVPAFANQVLEFGEREGLAYDMVFSHYWLSGEVACLLRPQMSAGWAHIAHTLGLVKNRTLAAGAHAEPALRIRVEGEISRQADLLIASTGEEASDLVHGYGADPERVVVVPPGVDLSVFQPIDRDEARRKIGYGPGRLLLFVGRLERLKGVEVAILALALLRDRAHDDVRLLILGEDSKDGDESEMERLKAIATAAGVRDRVDFLGSVAHHELPYFYSAADVCVMPSYSESFGLVGLEAQACGRPVVGSGVTGLRSVVRDDVSGYLIDSHDPATYAERIGRLLDNPELAQQMGRRGRLLAQRFSWTRTADRLEELFVGVVERAQVRVQAGARHE
ncbi:MAG: glycosyltransferase family 1 protein [Chloroflexi bacterium]|nr:MAG: glycosyltransferase family 1 protein [Chloroflexota bacterium]TME02376.1 MAG: glycosyltransferase family 1 protein [Chloroflexota bacterium]TME42386.1 MAG: glycosyltransferase family 1 protein [Chloroflexota bacterium]TME55139.1 MAG: glycosyltransferase family 1 protein [Chloroflexota bacterium]